MSTPAQYKMENDTHIQSSTAKVVQESREGARASGRGMDKGWLEGVHVHRTEKVLPSGPGRASVKPHQVGSGRGKLEIGIINH